MLVEVAVELDERHRLGGLVEHEVLAEVVDVGAQHQQVVGRLDRDEAVATDALDRRFRKARTERGVVVHDPFPWDGDRPRPGRERWDRTRPALIQIARNNRAASLLGARVAGRGA